MTLALRMGGDDARQREVAFLQIAHRQHDVRAAFGEHRGGVVADTGVGAGDDGDAAASDPVRRPCSICRWDSSPRTIPIEDQRRRAAARRRCGRQGASRRVGAIRRLVGGILDGVENGTPGPPVVGMVDPAHPPSRRAPLRWAVGGAVPWLLLAAGQLVWIGFDKRMPWLHISIAVLTVLGAATSLAVVPLWRYRVHRWELGPQAVYTRTGWLVQERRIAPISRVQTVDTYRGPLDRLFGLANVTVTTASSAGAVHIVALDVAVADHLVAQLTDIAAIGAEDAT